MPLKERPHEEPDITIVAFLGLTGSGMSSFIDRAAGQEAGKHTGHKLESHTKKIRDVRVKHPTSHRSYVLVDTPGFKDGKSDDTILIMLAEWLRQNHPKNPTLSGIVYLHRISDNRLTYSPIMNLSRLTGLCGQKSGSSVILATTMWSQVKKETATRRKSELETQQWKSMIDQGSEVIEFEDTAASAWKIIDRAVGYRAMRAAGSPTTTAPGIRKSQSLGTILTRNEVYLARGEGQVGAGHGSDHHLGQAKKPLLKRMARRIVGLF